MAAGSRRSISPSMPILLRQARMHTRPYGSTYCKTKISGSVPGVQGESRSNKTHSNHLCIADVHTHICTEYSFGMDTYLHVCTDLGFPCSLTGAMMYLPSLKSLGAPHPSLHVLAVTADIEAPSVVRNGRSVLCSTPRCGQAERATEETLEDLIGSNYLSQ